MEKIEKSGKTVEEAVSEALAALGIEKAQAEITILEEPVKGFLGFGSKPARVSVVRKYDPIYVATTFLQDVTSSMGLSVTVEASVKEKQMYVTMHGEAMGVLIGKRGQTLDSLQYLLNLVVNKESESYLSVILDTENYRQRRRDTLESLAANLARKVKQTRKSITLEPMNPYERRIIHSYLQQDRYVSTYSEGEEPYRNVVIAYKQRTQKPAAE